MRSQHLVRQQPSRSGIMASAAAMGTMATTRQFNSLAALLMSSVCRLPRDPMLREMPCGEV